MKCSGVYYKSFYAIYWAVLFISVRFSTQLKDEIIHISHWTHSALRFCILGKTFKYKGEKTELDMYCIHAIHSKDQNTQF